MKEVEDHERGRKLLSAVERIIDDTENIIAVVDRHAEHLRSEQPGIDEDDLRALVAAKLVSHYSTSSAISGGATALPALFPGAGSIIALTGGTLLDVAFVLKYEVEMSLALCWNFGFDIRQDRERELALLLASVLTHDESTGESFVNDVMKAEGQALWNYAPRQVPKLLAQIFARIAVRQAAKGIARVLPFVGIAVGAGMNKALTTKTGKQMVVELERRRTEGEHELPTDDVVEAAVHTPAPAEAEPEAEVEEEIVQAEVVAEPVPAKAPLTVDADPDPEPDDREAELTTMTYNQLRTLAKGIGIPARGKKAALIEAILAAEE
jgi:hypothetical protein